MFIKLAAAFTLGIIFGIVLTALFAANGEDYSYNDDDFDD